MAKAVETRTQMRARLACRAFCAVLEELQQLVYESNEGYGSHELLEQVRKLKQPFAETVNKAYGRQLLIMN